MFRFGRIVIQLLLTFGVAMLSTAAITDRSSVDSLQEELQQAV